MFCYLVATGYFHEHEWIDADCFSPQTCKTCGETTGEPRNHIWRMPTCTEYGFCTQCGQTKGAPLGHEFTSGGTDTPRTCKTCGFMRSLSLPQSGQVFIGQDLYTHSQLSITSSTSDSCYIKLKGSSGQDVFSFFVRAGDSVTVDVPSGYYYIYFSYGTDWYGTEYLFGDNTTYAKDDDLLDFENYTWEYTLQPMYGGNFSETPVDAEEFK